MPKLKIGIVGCGAIGSSLAKVITKDLTDQATLVALYDIDIKKGRNLSKDVSRSNISVNNLSSLIDKSQFVIEAASSKSSWEIAKNVLIKGRDTMIMSVGGIAGNFKELSRLAKKNNCKVYIPSGAISGIDALKAAKQGRLNKVTLTTRKNPLSFKGVKYIEDNGIKINQIKKDRVIFYGSAKKAVGYFPQNINVAGILSMAGMGLDKTLVKIIASPKVHKNIHEIEIESQAGRIFTRTENILHPENPKTSYLAYLSAVAILKQILEPVKIGT